jgi:hypothetical protein
MPRYLGLDLHKDYVHSCVYCPPLSRQNSVRFKWSSQYKLDTKFSNYCDAIASNWVGERYPSEECILFVL